MGERVDRNGGKPSGTLGRMLREIMAMLAPPPNMKVSEWAEANRYLTTETSSGTGRWKCSKAPYQTEIMNAFTQRGVREIVMMSCAQCGKSEILMNMIGRGIDLNPGPLMMVQPSQDTLEEFSKRRISTMIDACPALRRKVADAKARSSSNTIAMKTFPGGSLSIVSAQSAPQLRSKPIRDLFLDEIDGYPPSVGGEGDPVELAEKRTETFFNAKIVKASTPKNKSDSRIYKAYLRGTQEEWCVQCPNCGEYHFMRLEHFHCDYEEYEANGRTNYRVQRVVWRCPDCGTEHGEAEIKRQPGKWISRNERALQEGVRSFRLNAFASPWSGWKRIFKKWLESRGDPEAEQAFMNLTLGEPWERRVSVTTQPKELFDRREHYTAEVPDGVLVLTMGVDTQPNRLEFEVCGWGREHENWGILRGVIPGRPEDDATWEELDKLVDRHWLRRDGRKMKILTTFVDSGGANTQAVYKACARRNAKRVFAIKGEGGEGKEYVSLSGRMRKGGVILFNIGVDAGKDGIMYSLTTQESGPWYSHFPADEKRGYNLRFFEGLLSEEAVVHRVGGKQVIRWELRRDVNARNEPLDCRNYARAAFEGFTYDLNGIEERLCGLRDIQREGEQRTKKSGVRVISGGVNV